MPLAASEPVQKPAAIPETADQAMRAVLDGLHEDRPAAVWDALPASYQQEVNDLVHLFAGRTHPEAWKWFTQISRKGAIVLRLPADQERREAVAKLLDQIANTGPAGLESLSTIDVGALLRREESRTLLEAFHAAVVAAMGTVDMQDIFALVDDPSQVRFVLKESTDETAIVEIIFPNDVPGEIECVRVDGKWIPRALADTWAATLTDLKQGVLQALPSETATENFGPVFQYLGMIDLSFDGDLAHSRNDVQEDDTPADAKRSALLDAPLMVLEYLIAGPYEPESGEVMTDADGILMDLPPRSDSVAEDDNSREDASLFEQIVGKSLTDPNKRVAVLCLTGAAVFTEHPAFAAGVIEELSRRFKAGKINVIDADKIVSWVAENLPLAANSDLTALGADLAADFIVQFHFDTLEFSEENFPELRRGRARGVVSVVEFTAGEDGRKISKVIFKQPFQSKYPTHAPVSADAEEVDAFRLRYLARLHFELSRLFLSEP